MIPDGVIGERFGVRSRWINSGPPSLGTTC